MPRSLRRSPFAVLSALCVVIACSNASNDFFGEVSEAGTGGTAGSNTSKGGTASGSGGSSAGRAGSATAGTSASGGSAQSGGSTGASAGAPPIAGSSAGGSAATSGSSGDGAGEGGDTAEPSGGMGGTPEDMGGAGAGGTTGGGGAGATGGTNSGGTGAAGTSGNAGSGAAGSGGSGGSGGAPVCEDADDCESDEYCAKESCSAETGSCAPRPESCTGEQAVFSPVCGCDWMTYYTPCVAAREGVSVRSSGECSGNNRPTCNRDDGGDSCSPQRKGARCYRPRMGCEGTSASMGVCWVLPDECPDEEKVNTYCGGTSGDPECVGLCEVLDREDAVFRNSPACSD